MSALGATAARTIEDVCAALIAGGRDDDASVILRASLGHDSAIVREAAVLGVVEIFGSRPWVADLLTRVLADDPSSCVREACRDGLYVIDPGDRR